jgi:UDP-glucose 4-epimerase
MLARLSDRMDVYILRCANVYGYSRSMRFDAVINRFLFEAHFNGRISIQGSGTQKRAFIHINHVAQMLAQCAAPGLAPGCYNLVERNLSVGEIATALTEIYPQLERIYLEQDMGRRNLSVRPDLRLVLEPGDFIAQLRDFSARFSF